MNEDSKLHIGGAAIAIAFFCLLAFSDYNHRHRFVESICIEAKAKGYQLDQCKGVGQ